ncbi:MAG: hypothetical protein JO048_14265, partial [Methylobacteriaceae bacterium]|nr:hypothetical protein [Methylobacteriaceae bacterium]
MPRLTGRVHRRASARLVPERDVVALQPRGFRALGPEPWLAIALPGGVPAEGWLRLRYRTDWLSDPVRPLLRFDRAGGEPAYAILPGPVCGAATWTGRVPDGTTGLAISPVRHPGPFDFALDEVRPLGRL